MKNKIFSVILSIIMVLGTFVFTNAAEQIKTTEFVAVADARVNLLDNKNYGGKNYVDIRTDKEGNFTVISYLKFNLEGIDRTDIKSAKLVLFATDVNRYPHIGVAYSDDVSWIEGSGDGAAAKNGEINGTNAPAYSGYLGNMSKPSAQYSPAYLDITDFALDHCGAFTLVLYATKQLNYPATYATREDPDETRRPKIVVETYDYERVITEIQTGDLSYIEKNENVATDYNPEIICKDQYGYKILGATPSISINNAEITYDGKKIHIPASVNSPYFRMNIGGGNVTLSKKVYLADYNKARTVTFADTDSKTMHNLTVKNANILTDYITFKPDGYAEFEISVSPVLPNYITVKLWGSDATNTCLILDGSEESFSPAYGTCFPELDRNAGNKVMDNGFVYSSYLLPEWLTTGKTKVKLKLYSTGQATPYNSNPYATQTENSRRIYEIKSHTDTDYDFISNEGYVRDENGIPLSGSTNQYESLKASVITGIEKLMSWQAYGSKYDTHFEQYPETAMFSGIIGFNGVGQLYKTKEEWKNTNYSRMFTSNLAVMNSLHLFADAYNINFSKYYQDEQMLDRIVKFIDFLCIAQGSNGGFQSAGGNWIGGPSRIKANGSALEGFGQKGISMAILKIYDSIEDRMDELIDNDDNTATAKVTRRKAYTDMLVLARNHMAETGAGHAPNQDAADKLAMYYHNEAIGLLTPSQKWDREKVLSYAYEAAGFNQNIYGNYWVSEKGIAMEPRGNGAGGYDPGYSPLASEDIFRLAYLLNDSAMIERAHNMIDAMSYFFYESKTDDGYSIMRNESSIGWRNNYNPPRDENYMMVPSLSDKHPVLMKMAEKYLEHGRIYSLKLGTYNAHLINNIEAAEELFLNFDKIKATDYKLPYEKNEFFFSDEVAEVIAMKNSKGTYFLTMDFRNRLESDVSTARIHFMSDNSDITVRLEQKNPYGERKLGVCEFMGNTYLINSDANNSYTYDGITVNPLSCKVVETEEKETEYFMENNLVTIKNNRKEPISGTLCVASYDNDGKLSDIISKEIFVHDGETEQIDTSGEIKGENLRLFLWKNMCPVE